MSDFPKARLRRLREMPAIRRMLQETRVSIGDLVYPLFVTRGKGKRIEIGPMPGVFQLSIDNLVSEVVEIRDMGIPAILLFGLPELKDSEGHGAYDADGIVQEACRAIKGSVPDMLVITDVCLCGYTDHGHCGLIRDGKVDNDATVDLLARISVSLAEAGADIVAPSAMMDGQVLAIRSALDSTGYLDVPIMSYSAKYASSFYGPFRTAANSIPQFSDRSGYQVDPTSTRQALLEIERDISEGVDIVMVKPALAYLDIIAKAREAFDVPIAAYNVSGEYSMVKAAGENEWVNASRATMEIITAIKRAGADIIISYHAKELAEWFSRDSLT